MKSLVGISFPFGARSWCQSHQGDLKKFKKAFETTIQTFVQLGVGEQTTNTHIFQNCRSLKGRSQIPEREMYRIVHLPLHIQINYAGTKHPPYILALIQAQIS